MSKPLNPLLLIDGYKSDHRRQYPNGTEFVYSNFTPRGSRIAGTKHVVLFGLQYFLKEYLVDQFNEGFFNRSEGAVVREYQRYMDAYLGRDAIPVDHVRALHQLQYLPIRVKALPEGTQCPLRVPMVTICNTRPEFFWLTNMLETLMSNILWLPCTSATTALRYRKLFERYAQKSAANGDLIKFQGHDFSFRGMAGTEAAKLSGAGHLTSFAGTDTVPALHWLEQYYGANVDSELVGCSVSATEHSVMCMGGESGEVQTIRRLITDLYPQGIVSIVADTWDFWQFVCDYLPQLKPEIMARQPRPDGQPAKLVTRPDSGDPVKVVVGDPDAPVGSGPRRGAIETLWDIFEGTLTANGFKELDSHVGLIYGDGINYERAEAILSGLYRKGFASTNVVLGMGSYTYQFVTRDTYGFAVKATAGRVNGQDRAIYKQPKTDDGEKHSARGLLCVVDGDNDLELIQNCTPEQEQQGRLRTVFENGYMVNQTTLSDIRKILHPGGL